jgi:quercetin dioxygenase-like cupin family protein
MTHHNIFTDPIHLGLGATALPQPPMTGMEWYEGYAARTAADGVEGRLVAMHKMDEDWPSWEMHPHGEEVVICVAGCMTLRQEFADGTEASVTIHTGDYIINPPGCWHIADIAQEVTALFITAGLGTETRPR